jgi:hypothetical protein
MYFHCKRHEKWIIGAINSHRKEDCRKMDAIFGDLSGRKERKTKRHIECLNLKEKRFFMAEIN